jgi:2-oxoglutarate dehydrogenase E2 component (dihydrolipoamide succinyltransferase)
MAIDLVIPNLGESIVEAQIAEWLVAEGDTVKKDQAVATLDSEKATVDLPAPASGKVTKLLKPKGATVKIGEAIGQLEPGGAESNSKETQQPAKASNPPPPAKPEKKESAPKLEEAKTSTEKPAVVEATTEKRVMPAAQRLLDENNLSAADVPATGPGGRLLKEDVSAHVENNPSEKPDAAPPPTTDSSNDEIIPMTPLRRTIAKRLVEAQHTMALLSTFNEVDMGAVIALRKENQEAFQKHHGVNLGFMSFFVKAVIEALKMVPQLNAEIRGNDIVYHHDYDIGVAIGGGKGLVVPPLRNAERMSFAEVERAIADLAKRAQENKLKLEELSGGTFTISNGGIYGSMLSTPIINPPQSGILGLHAIQDRPVAREGQVVIRPMMFVALSYDHRIVDGREAVTFLKRVKELIESPARILLEV